MADPRFPRTHKIWRTSEVNYLKDNYNDLTLMQLAAGLNRTRNSIIYMAASLGLRKEKKFFQIHKRKEVPNG